MTIFAERASESQVLGKYKHSISVLPVEDLVHFKGMTVRHAREVLNATARILNALLHNAPAGYPASVRRELRNVMFHVRTALSQLDAYIGAGYYQDDDISKVPGVEDGIYNHHQALKKAQQQWGIWMALEKQEKKQGLKGFEELTGNTTASDVSDVGYGYFGYADYGSALGYEEEDDDLGSVFTDVLAEMGKPVKGQRWGTVGLAVAGAAALVGLYVWRGRK